ncbi:CNH domain-containing protein [Earliella scabrosa]|nr:CNH domain-containing protein [Earliella scabrosa]
MTERVAAEPLDERAKVLWYSERLVLEGNQAADVDFSNPTRKVIHAGPLLRQNDPLKRSVNGWKELWVVLFDNYLVMAKQKGKGDDLKYVAWKPPVRLEFLSLVSQPVRPVQRSNTLSRMMRSGRDSPDPFSSLEHILDTINLNPGGSTHAHHYPFSFVAQGKHGGSYSLYAPTLDERNEWRRKIRDAVAARKAVQEERSVFQVETITADTADSQDAPAHHPGLVTGRISCSLPFASNDGHSLIAIGSEDGVWIGLPKQPESIQRVISLKQVTQLAFLADYGFFIILAEKASTLYAIGIESVVPTTAPEQPPFGMQKLNGEDKPVQFFSVGRQAGRTLVIYSRRKGLDSVFRVLEVLPPSAGERRFRMYREFFIPSDSHDLLFLKTKICVLCTRGFVATLTGSRENG